MLTEIISAVFLSPIGPVRVEASLRGIRSVAFCKGGEEGDLLHPWLRDGVRELKEYFAGERKCFTSLALVMQGTDFQQAVWEAAMTIPYGETVTYGELACSVGKKDAARAVGSALKVNPLLLIVPCHRVVPARGGVGEYGAGSERKRWLLSLEQSSFVV
ncbi:cysteine methyltransferase [Candidatus Peregrinibacteria bacterium CG10_big_fil_rev_8_21_14_0_10_55_24]|nr:MAG: cysteine methyltransferase [Candidatus Peregrinibacteria bacterium CG10_big_fil_rev_8_21_14_0_10_55_24]